MDENLIELWHALLHPYHCYTTRAAYLDGVLKRYAEPHRHYHTLEHIGEMTEVIGQYQGRLTEYEAVALAAWFHDVVYDPRSRDNEACSAVLAMRVLARLMVPGWIRARVGALIRATSDHVPPDRSFDAALFLDADLAILGSEPERYARYSADLRREFSHVDDDAWRAGRSAFLRTMLEREAIFATPEVRGDLEEAARRNMEGELRGLSDGGDASGFWGTMGTNWN